MLSRTKCQHLKNAKDWKEEMQKENIEELIQNCKQIIDVTKFGADPTGRDDSTSAISQALESAKGLDGLVVIDFPEGIYQLQKGTAQKRIYHTSNTDSIRFPEKQIALLLEEQDQVIFNGNGALFMIHGDCMALAVVRSKNVYLHNFSWDFAVPTTIEMTVYAIGEENGEQYTDFSIPARFPFSVDDEGENVTWFSEIDPCTGEYYWTDRNHKDAWTVVGYHPDINMTRRYDLHLGPFSASRTKIIRLSDTKIRIFYGEERPAIHTKDLVIEFCSTPRRETAGAFIWESEDTIIEKVNVHYLHAFGWLTQMSHNVSYIDCTFMTREGSGTYTSGYADLIHVSGASGHIHIEGCTFKHSHDDPINIHGTFTRVEEQIDAHTLKLRYVHPQQGGFPQYYIGNEVVFYRRDTLTPASMEGKRYKVTAVTHPSEGGNDLQTMIVTFDEEIPNEVLEKYDGEPLIVAENITYTPTVHIKNNHFETVSTRGILCTTSKEVIIEENTFKHMAMDSIYISNDSQDWYESGPIRDMMIRKNTFFVTKVGDAGWRNAAIRIFPVTKGNKLPNYDEAIHRNIRIEENNFYMEHESVLVANSVDQLIFKNNHIYTYDPKIDEQYAETIPPAEGKQGTNKQTFEISACQHVSIEANNFEANVRPTLSYSNMPVENIEEKGSNLLDQALQLDESKLIYQKF